MAGPGAIGGICPWLSGNSALRDSGTRGNVGGDQATPLDLVTVLVGECLDLGFRLRDLDPRGLAVSAAARALPGDFLAEPVTVVVIDDQTLHQHVSENVTK